MGDSNAEWGDLASHDQELAAAWDSYERLPEPGENPILDRFVDRKNLSIPALIRVGAKLSSETVLAFAFPGGIKYRNILTDERWSYEDSSWDRLKVVPAQHGESATAVLVAEGETDAARLTDLYPHCDVAVQGGGAKYVPLTFAEQLANYEVVYVALDDDEAGNDGAAKWAELLTTTVRVTPPDNDWCELTGEAPPLPTPPADEPCILVTAGDLVTLEPPEVVSWFEHALLPVGGLLVLHGWLKSFKSFLGFDIMAALAQGQPWAHFEPTEEPCRTAVIQYEIPWPYYQQRVRLLRERAREQRAFDANYLTWDPTNRPRLIAGNRAQEDFVLQTLVDNNVQVVLIDPIRRFAGTIDVNAENEVRKVLGFFERLQNEGITVVTTHHDNKESGRHGGGDAIGMTGSGAFGGDPDTIVSVELPRGESYRDSPRRNLQFTFRNAPILGGRGMEMQEDGSITYITTTHGPVDELDDEGPAI